MGTKKPTARENENAIHRGGGGKGKSKKKALVIDDDEYSIGTELSQEPMVQGEKVAPEGGEKKGKKGNLKKSETKDDHDHNEVEEQDVAEEDEAPVIQFAGKKKSKGKKSGANSVFSDSNFGLLGVEDNDDESSGLLRDKEFEGGASEQEGQSVGTFMGKKKSSRPKKGGGSLFTASVPSAIGDEDDEGGVVDNSASGRQSDNDDELVIALFGKKKTSETSKKAGHSVFLAYSLDGLDEGEENKYESKEEDEDVASNKIIIHANQPRPSLINLAIVRRYREVRQH